MLERMKIPSHIVTFLAGALLVSAVVPGCAAMAVRRIANAGESKAEPATMTPQQALEAANTQFYVALNKMLAGDATEVDKCWSHTAGVTNFGPFGKCDNGWQAVSTEFAKEAGMKMGGNVRTEAVVVTVGADMGYATCVEVGNMNINGESVEVRFRSTNVYRLERGEWKLVHHHTDPSPTMQAPPQVANASK